MSALASLPVFYGKKIHPSCVPLAQLPNAEPITWESNPLHQSIYFTSSFIFIHAPVLLLVPWWIMFSLFKSNTSSYS